MDPASQDMWSAGDLARVLEPQGRGRDRPRSTDFGLQAAASLGMNQRASTASFIFSAWKCAFSGSMIASRLPFITSGRL